MQSANREMFCVATEHSSDDCWISVFMKGQPQCSSSLLISLLFWVELQLRCCINHNMFCTASEKGVLQINELCIEYFLHSPWGYFSTHSNQTCFSCRFFAMLLRWFLQCCYQMRTFPCKWGFGRFWGDMKCIPDGNVRRQWCSFKRSR